VASGASLAYITKDSLNLSVESASKNSWTIKLCHYHVLYFEVLGFYVEILMVSFLPFDPYGWPGSRERRKVICTPPPLDFKPRFGLQR
jgi:hypothetical protein